MEVLKIIWSSFVCLYVGSTRRDFSMYWDPFNVISMSSYDASTLWWRPPPEDMMVSMVTVTCNISLVDNSVAVAAAVDGRWSSALLFINRFIIVVVIVVWLLLLCIFRVLLVWSVFPRIFVILFNPDAKCLLLASSRLCAFFSQYYRIGRLKQANNSFKMFALKKSVVVSWVTVPCVDTCTQFSCRLFLLWSVVEQFTVKKCLVKGTVAARKINHATISKVHVTSARVRAVYTIEI